MDPEKLPAEFEEVKPEPTRPMNQQTLFGSRMKAQNQWQMMEKELFKSLLRKYGKDWQSIAKELPNRTPQQCRNYF